MLLAENANHSLGVYLDYLGDYFSPRSQEAQKSVSESKKKRKKQHKKSLATTLMVMVSSSRSRRFLHQNLKEHQDKDEIPSQCLQSDPDLAHRRGNRWMMTYSWNLASVRASPTQTLSAQSMSMDFHQIKKMTKNQFRLKSH